MDAKNNAPVFTGRPLPPKKQEYSKPRLDRSVEPEGILNETNAMIGTRVRSLISGKKGEISERRKQHQDQGPPLICIGITWENGRKSTGNLIPPDEGDFVMLRIER